MTTRTRLSALATTAALTATGGLLTATPAAAAVTCASPAWKAEYYANTTLTGTPKLTTCDSAIAENYGYGDPAGVTLPKDNFGVRWTLTRDFGSGGPFTFTAEAQDGIRVSLDGVRKIDLWKNTTTTQKKTVNLTIPSGRHTIVVHYATWTGAANVKVTYAPVTSATVDKVRPLAPTGFGGWYDWSGDLKTRVNWTANKEMDLAGYSVYRRLSTSTTWTRISGTTPLTSRTYADVPPPTGQEYVYEVRARDKAGNESAGSNDQTIGTVDRTGPAAPSGLAVDTGALINALSWRAVPDAVRYDVEAADQATGPYTLLASVIKPSHQDMTSAIGVPRYYRVRAYDAAGNPSAYSATASGDRVDRTPPAPPTGLNSYVEVSATNVYWDAPDFFDTDFANGGTYRVYRSPGSTLDQAALTRVTCAEGSDFDSNHGRCVDLDTSAGAYYTYAVMAVDPYGNESALSAPLTVRTGDRVAPGPVTGVTATPRADGVLVRWNASTADDLDDAAYAYSVWTGAPQADGSVKWLSSTSCSSRNTREPLADLCGGLPDGETYVYAVVANDRWDNHLPPSDPAVVKVTATELDVRPSVQVTTAWELGSIGHNSRTAAPYQPSIHWGCAATVTACETVTGYRMSRWNEATKAYEPQHAGLIQVPASGTWWTDTTATPGSTYFYLLEALRADGSVAGTYAWYTVYEDRV
ncbi:PA14 domain-containing protein [Streptomyces vietnamensis]|uniref:PA14 domain-containing protein n=1 Tax=Streptomyces vietnamensis TaxID=362257 RepID=UPI000696BD77|nr:PA14 domain-containing protein [Streptomyces vietnamensis]